MPRQGGAWDHLGCGALPLACNTAIAVSTKAAHGLAARALPLSARAFVEELFARYFQPSFHTKLFPTQALRWSTCPVSIALRTIPSRLRPCTQLLLTYTLPSLLPRLAPSKPPYPSDPSPQSTTSAFPALDCSCLVAFHSSCGPPLANPSDLSNCWSLAHNSFLRFRDCRLAPSKPPYPSDPRCSFHWAFHSCLATGRGFRRGLAAAAYWPVIPVGLSSCGGHARNSFLRFRDCRLAPSKPPYPLDPSLQRPLGFPATGRGFRRGLAAAVIPVGLSSCGGHAHNSFLRFRDFKTSVFFGSLAAVHYLCFSSPWLQLLSGLSFQLRTSPCKSHWP